jgi:spoIIIJ-associated protein
LLEDLREETLEPVEDVAGLEEEDDYEEGNQPRRVEEADVVEHARQVLSRLVAALDPLAAVSASANEQGILLEVDSREAGTLIGRRGQNLEALQYLATRIVAHKAGRPVRLNVDAGGYRGRRREALEDLARKAAAKARSGGKPVAVGPLSSPERRVVHMTLKNEPGVFTASRGRGEMKKVIVSAR